jgi:cysteine synthase A
VGPERGLLQPAMSITSEPTSVAGTLRVAESLLELIGHTPMLHLRRLSPPDGAQVYAKLESFNPGGSVKDRVALGMLLDAERNGFLQTGGTVVEATAGNTGVGLALVGVNRGYRVVLFVPEGYAEEKTKLMRGLGAEVIRTPEDAGMAGAIAVAKEYTSRTPGGFMVSQFENPANPDYHALTTGKEIIEQMAGKVDAFVAGCGSGGTFTGVSRTLKHELGSQVYTVAVETEGSVLGGGEPGKHKVEGIGASFIPKTFDYSVADKIMAVTDEDAFAMVIRLGREEGLLGGSSAGAAVHAAVEVARTMLPEQRVVTIIPDSAERYLSKGIFEGGR